MFKTTKELLWKSNLQIDSWVRNQRREDREIKKKKKWQQRRGGRLPSGTQEDIRRCRSDLKRAGRVEEQMERRRSREAMKLALREMRG